MSKQSDQIFRFARLVCVFFLFWGCGKEEPPPKAKIVTKKIVREKDAASSPAQHAVSKDLPKTGSEKPPMVVQKPADTSKPSVSDQKKPKPSAEKPAEKAKEQQKLPDIPISAVDQADKPSEKIEEKSVSGASETSQKPPGKKAVDLVFPDMPGLETEAKATAAYDSKNRMDPFAPLFKEEPKKPKEATASIRILTPLEKVDLSQLKLVGIVRGGSGTRALVEESSGKGYIIKKGTLIGIHSGKVADILEDKVLIEEEHEDYVGNEIDGWTRNITVRKREMKLQKSPGDEL